MGSERDFVLASRYLYQHLPSNLAENGHLVILGCLDFLATAFEACRTGGPVGRDILQQSVVANLPGFMNFLESDCNRLGVPMSQVLFQLSSQLDLAPICANMSHFQVHIVFSFLI